MEEFYWPNEENQVFSSTKKLRMQNLVSLFEVLLWCEPNRE